MLLAKDDGFSSSFFMSFSLPNERGKDMGIIFRDIIKKYHDKVVLSQIGGALGNGEKIGLVGHNGVGKSTLAKILSRAEEPDDGCVKYAPHQLLVIYLQQYPDFTPGFTVYQELYQTMRSSDTKNNTLDALVRKRLNQHEIPEPLWYVPAADLSGGEKTKLILCKAFAQDFDVSILDEPTNHLDLEGMLLLEKVVKQMQQAVLLISHNRYLLDQVTDKTWELSAAGLKSYKGNYSAYKVQKDLETKQHIKEYKKQQLRINQIKQDIHRKRAWLVNAEKNSDYKNAAKTHASAIKAKEKELVRLQASKIERPRTMPAPAFALINQFMAPIHKISPVVIRANQIAKAYGARTIFSGASFTIERGDKIALLGMNGAGKSTLLKIISGIDAQYEGELRIDPALKIGYLSQDFSELNLQSTILDSVSEYQSHDNIRTLLACMLFQKNNVFKKIDSLSMGEKSRVAFVHLLLSGANFLVLDEPTNYLDLWTREQMENVLEQYAGGMIFVTHDLYFVQRIANKIMQLENGVLKFYRGDYAYYSAKQRAEAQQNAAWATMADLDDRILQLEYDLAYLAGKLSKIRNEEEQMILHREYLEKVKLLRELRT